MENLTIGITGGIGAGKSMVCRILRANGFFVYDCDSRAKWIMSNNLKVKTSLKNKFGEDVYLADGSINKKLMAKMVFDNPDSRDYVNRIVHSSVFDDIVQKRREIDGWFFIESAILASGGLIPMCDQVWIVTAPQEERLQRVINRDNLDINQIKNRMIAQENEMTLLNGIETCFLDNGYNLPLMGEILKLTNLFNLKQNYILSC